jgi:hypothetical protein
MWRLSLGAGRSNERIARTEISTAHPISPSISEVQSSLRLATAEKRNACATEWRSARSISCAGWAGTSGATRSAQ